MEQRIDREQDDDGAASGGIRRGGPGDRRRPCRQTQQDRPRRPELGLRKSRYQEPIGVARPPATSSPIAQAPDT
jgi:hypothetical protein